MQRKIFNGQNTNDYFGGSVHNAGDVNGDGYDDIIVGANGYNFTTGRAYIYYGGINMNTVADVILTGESTSNDFGVSVAAAGDVNGDGYSDVIVGAEIYGSGTGRAYIFFGGAGMNNIADVTMTGEAANNYFGISVSTAGDVNGDGFSDVIVGAYKYTNFTGRAYIFFGGASMDNVADVTMTGEAVNNYFGLSVSAAGDVNGDGYSDVITGAYAYDRAYIFFGGAGMNNIADVTMTGEAVNNGFGASVSSAGDLNGDGFSDIIVGAYIYSSYTGKVYIFFGGSVTDNIADVTMTGEAVNNYFGNSVSTAGDVNGDGYSDVIVGANGYSSNTGRAYIFFGGSSMNNVADVTITGEATNNYFGGSVSGAGDVNGDGYSDVIAGAIGYNSNTGRVYLYNYFMNGEITSDLSATGEATNNYFGISVSTAGDVNGDGISDVIVGARGNNSFTGKAYIFFGGSVTDNIADVTMTGEAVNNSFGNSVSTAGDVNGDGYSDVIVGAYQFSSFTGRAYIYFGGASMNNVADVTMTGEATSNDFGYSVSAAGDVNSDGYPDVIVGAYGYNSFTGRAYIYFGGASMNNIADVNMTGEAINNNLGFSVSAGDVNGDGYSDVIAGAYGYSSSTGRAYIFFGGASMNNVADVTMTGEAVGNNFGSSVSMTGDVNGDGYSDVVAGAYGYSSSTGRAYIFLGGASMNNTSDVTMTGEGISHNFGNSVSSAGDINGDGYSDVIIGAFTYNPLGKAYVFFGGSSVNNVPDVTMTDGTSGNGFGSSVSAAGDLNGDGYADVIVGASGYSSNAGRAYIYYGSAISAKPILIYVKDVPNDQGGFVDLKWARSSYDVIGQNVVTSYIVQRSAPPIGGNFAWVNVASITATKEAFYSYIASMPYDSSGSSPGTFFFRITALTSDVNQFWRSAILSGHSIDNIAPLMLSPFTASSEGSNVRLNWKRSAAPDLMNYVLFRSTSPTIDPYTETPFATLGDSTYLDTSPLSGIYYYFVVAQDIHNNKSPVAVAESPSITVNITMFIEGFYNASSNSQVSDTIIAELHNNTSPFAMVDQSEIVVSTNGSAVVKFSDAPSGTYYLILKHRNSIETWSANEISLTSGGSVNYNFSNAVTQAFGSNLKSIDASPVRFGIFSGDENQDGTIDVGDIVDVYNDVLIGNTGYVNTDINGDEFVDVSDLIIAYNNSLNVVSVITP